MQLRKVLRTFAHVRHAHYDFSLFFLIEQAQSKNKSKSHCFMEEHYNMRVRSWLRMNAGGVPNTCKSNEAHSMNFSEGKPCDLVADG